MALAIDKINIRQLLTGLGLLVHPEVEPVNLAKLDR
jgi:hypothetical protein